MSENKSSISKASSYREIGEFWDTHDLGDFEGQTYPVEFDVHIESSRVYVPVEKDVAAKLRAAAETRGLSTDSLLDQWLKEKIAEEPVG
ncbi:MAG TPA: CopG family antitoxin, partial [Thermoanaerobaculia bacterium]|nr:CopG family antitoxin [Thermoanaerobaculia bacterium]